MIDKSIYEALANMAARVESEVRKSKPIKPILYDDPKYLEFGNRIKYASEMARRPIQEKLS